MKKLAFIFLGILFSASVFAQDVCYEYAVDLPTGYGRAYFDSPDEACKYYVGVASGSTSSWIYFYTHNDGAKCYYDMSAKLSTSQSKSSRSLFKKTVKCKDKCSSRLNERQTFPFLTGWANINTDGTGLDVHSRDVPAVPSSICYDGCGFNLSGILDGSVSLGDSNNEGYFRVFQTHIFYGDGKSCVGGDNQQMGGGDGIGHSPVPSASQPGSDTSSISNTCPTGQCPGVLNGVEMCVPCDPDPAQSAASGADSAKPGASGADPAKPGASGADPAKPSASNPTSTSPPASTASAAGGGGGGGSGSGSGKGDGDGDGNGVGPSLGDQPGLYERRYKDGIKGVWGQKMAQLEKTKLGSLSKRLMPKVNSGDCPKWELDLNFGKNMNFGSFNLAPPCMIWPVLRAIVLVCSLMLARRLVFGG